VADRTATDAGNAHCGYARVHRINGAWLAPHLRVGGNNGRRGSSVSSDGRKRKLDPRGITSRPNLTDGGARGAVVMQLFEWGGKVLGIGLDRPKVFSLDLYSMHIVIGEVAPDMRYFTAKPEPALEMGSNP
jgi:hypothetical protein